MGERGFTMVKKKEIVIQSLKHDGTFHRKWHENTILKQTKDEIIGINDATKVTDYDGTIWTSTEPAIFYFHAKKWFNVIAMLKKEDRKSTRLNSSHVASSYAVFCLKKKRRTSLTPART